MKARTETTKTPATKGQKIMRALCIIMLALPISAFALAFAWSEEPTTAPVVVAQVTCAHESTAVEGASEPTCTASGSTGVQRCCACGEITSEAAEIPAFGHVTEIVDAVDATCTEAGYTGNLVCTVCNEIIESGDEIPATGHDIYLSGKKVADCANNGYTGNEKCRTCGEVFAKGEVIVATGAHAGGTATCTEKAKCTGCGCEYGEILAHKTERQNVVAATCDTNGYSGDLVCIDCGEVVEAGVAVMATGHKTCRQGKVEPTYENAGFTGDLVCEKCGMVTEAGTTVPMLVKEPAFIGAAYSAKDAAAITRDHYGRTGETCSILKVEYTLIDVNNGVATFNVVTPDETLPSDAAVLELAVTEATPELGAIVKLSIIITK